jgi:hypothetical protein
VEADASTSRTLASFAVRGGKIAEASSMSAISCMCNSGRYAQIALPALAVRLGRPSETAREVPGSWRCAGALGCGAQATALADGRNRQSSIDELRAWPDPSGSPRNDEDDDSDDHGNAEPGHDPSGDSRAKSMRSEVVTVELAVDNEHGADRQRREPGEGALTPAHAVLSALGELVRALAHPLKALDDLLAGRRLHAVALLSEHPELDEAIRAVDRDARPGRGR